MEPKLVKDAPPPFRVRRVGHGDPADIEQELEEAEADGYGLQTPLAHANGDVVLIFRRSRPAKAKR